MYDLEQLHDSCYKIVHLSDVPRQKVDDFSIARPEGNGLERYIKNTAWIEEKSDLSRTYVVSDITSDDMIVGYFTLRTGLITVSNGLFSGFDTYTGVELANFAVNDRYKEAHDVIPKLGVYMFDEFILPMVKDINAQIGAKYLYIFALPQNKLMEHYQTMGFHKSSRRQARFIYRHVKPVYDKSCIFMWQPIN